MTLSFPGFGTPVDNRNVVSFYGRVTAFLRLIAASEPTSGFAGVEVPEEEPQYPHRHQPQLRP